MVTATPWIGHCAKLRRRRQVLNRRDKQASRNQSVGDKSMEERAPDSTTVTRHGQIIRKPARFYVVNSLGSIHNKEGEVVRSRDQLQRNTKSGERAKREIDAKTPY